MIVPRLLGYHVFWKGYDSSEATWEPAGNVNKEAGYISGVLRKGKHVRRLFVSISVFCFYALFVFRHFCLMVARI